jgi:dUTPase
MQSIRDTPPPLQVQLLSDKGRAPTRGSLFAAGYDLYSSQDTTVPARGKAMVETDISIAVPESTCTSSVPASSRLGVLFENCVPAKKKDGEKNRWSKPN